MSGANKAPGKRAYILAETQKKKAGTMSARLLILPPSCFAGLNLALYLPEVELAAGCEFAFGMLTYPLTVFLPTLFTTISSG
jgi:hypothetical protein